MERNGEQCKYAEICFYSKFGFCRRPVREGEELNRKLLSRSEPNEQGEVLESFACDASDYRLSLRDKIRIQLDCYGFRIRPDMEFVPLQEVAILR